MGERSIEKVTFAREQKNDCFFRHFLQPHAGTGQSSTVSRWAQLMNKLRNALIRLGASG
jgi:hypothetical protein